MKIKVTIWLDDPETIEFNENVKKDLKNWIENDAFADSGCEILQIEIEESNWEETKD
jgi:hypothetical protein